MIVLQCRSTITNKVTTQLMNNSDRLRRNYLKFVTIRQQRGLDKKKQKLPASCYDKHHIQPKSCGGGDEDSNLVLLTFREHWTAHYLLDQFSEGDDKGKMQFALSRMSSRAKPGQLLPVAFAIGKAAKSEALAALVAAGKHHWQTEEHSAALAKRNKELAAEGLHPAQKEGNRAATSKRLTGLTEAGLHPFQSEENRAATSKRTTKRNKDLAAIGLNPFQSAENRAASSKRMTDLAAIGLHPGQSPASRAASSKRLTELAEAGLHPSQSAENRAATSKRNAELAATGDHPAQSPANLAALSKRNKEQVTCPHCSKTGSRGGMQRWHFDNCKHNPASKRFVAK